MSPFWIKVFIWACLLFIAACAGAIVWAIWDIWQMAALNRMPR